MPTVEGSKTGVLVDSSRSSCCCSLENTVSITPTSLLACLGLSLSPSVSSHSDPVSGNNGLSLFRDGDVLAGSLALALGSLHRTSLARVVVCTRMNLHAFV